MKKELRKKWAKILDGRDLGSEISREEHELMKKDKILAIYGASDDLAEIGGVIYDEVGIYEGGVIPFLDGDLLKKECDNDDCPHEEKMLEKAKTVRANWCPDDDGCSWKYETEIPHETFKVYEDGQLYCVGIIIHQEDLF